MYSGVQVNHVGNAADRVEVRGQPLRGKATGNLGPQEEQNSANFSFVGPSSEKLWVRKQFHQNALL